MSSIYTGIVIDKDNPKYPGKVQVYIIGKGPTIPAKKGNTSKFLYAGNDEGIGDLSISVLTKLREVCPWASVMQTISGGSNAIRTDSKTGKTTASQHAITTDEFNFEGSHFGALPAGAKFNEYGVRADAFANPSLTLTRNCNFAGLDYFPENYPNSPNGVFNLPDINAYVYVTFLGKNDTIPVIIGAAPRMREITEILNYN